MPVKSPILSCPNMPKAFSNTRADDGVTPKIWVHLNKSSLAFRFALESQMRQTQRSVCASWAGGPANALESEREVATSRVSTLRVIDSGRGIPTDSDSVTSGDAPGIAGGERCIPQSHVDELPMPKHPASDFETGVVVMDDSGSWQQHGDRKETDGLCGALCPGEQARAEHFSDVAHSHTDCASATAACKPRQMDKRMIHPVFTRARGMTNPVQKRRQP